MLTKASIPLRVHFLTNHDLVLGTLSDSENLIQYFIEVHNEWMQHNWEAMLIYH